MSNALLVDIGNSSTLLATVKGGEIQKKTVATTHLSALGNDILAQDYAHIVVASVVPSATTIFEEKRNVTYASSESIPHLKVNLTDKDQVGADRLVTAMAAYRKCGGPVAVIDSGTAITFCLVDGDGVYQGGSIFPGMRIASKSLNDYTAKIPLIYVSPQDSLLGKNTKQAVEIGLYYGYIDMINGMIQRYQNEYPELTVVGTGNGFGIVEAHIQNAEYCPDLMLDGLLEILGRISL